ncbi:MAG: fused MFS/spermidine synthase [Candidatus Pacebacteria bacterium]|nr:fused MFS/spermidine synthase [Candidatus Paceibacterota bacterium]
MKIFYGVASFLAGFSIMTIELVSSRIVAPLIGNSVFTWTSVIGVTLLGLSVGSWFGGKLADMAEEKKWQQALSIVFIISAFLTSVIPNLASGFSHILDSSVSIEWLNIILALGLFFLPATAVGMIQPMILKKFAIDFTKIGKEYGSLSALWSLGSIIGVFLTGFFFISTMGSSVTIYTVASILFFVGIVLMIITYHKDGNNFHSKKIVGLIFFLGVLSVSSVFAESHSKSVSVALYDKETDYFHVRVLDKYLNGFGDSRLLFLDFDSHSIDSKQISAFFYPEMYPVFKFLKKDLSNTVFIGAGAYTMPRSFKKAYASSTVSVIELDPAVEQIGKEYFNLGDYDIKTIAGDARLTISRSSQKYDLIFNDAFNSFISVPWYLITKEWDIQAKSKLNPGGIYAVNFIGSLKGDKALFTQSVTSTFAEVFPNYYVFTFGTDPTEVQNIVLVGINGDMPITETKFKDLLVKDKSAPGHAFLSDRLFVGDKSFLHGADVLTDDFAPTEKLMKPIVEAYFPEYLEWVKTTW